MHMRFMRYEKLTLCQWKKRADLARATAWPPRIILLANIMSSP